MGKYIGILGNILQELQDWLYTWISLNFAADGAQNVSTKLSKQTFAKTDFVFKYAIKDEAIKGPRRGPHQITWSKQQFNKR